MVGSENSRLYSVKTLRLSQSELITAYQTRDQLEDNTLKYVVGQLQIICAQLEGSRIKYSQLFAASKLVQFCSKAGFITHDSSLN